VRIECDKCGAKYSIADEKVRGKTFKIRCKKCSNVIIVRDKAAGADAAAADGPEEDESEPAGWHLAIDGETVGPLSEAEVRQRYDAGQIDRSTSTWQEGFDDWVELGSIDAFADLADPPVHARGAGRAAVVASAPVRNDDPFASSGDDAFAASSGEYGGLSSQPVAASKAAAVAESPRVSAASLTGQRNENSVLFSLDSLKSVATARPSSAGPVRQAPSTTAPSSEGSGLIDIRAMGAMLGGQPGAPSHSGGGPADDEVLPSFGGGGLGGLSVEPLASETPVVAAIAPPPPQRSNAPMYILIVLLLVGLVGLGAYIFLKEPDAPQVIEKTVTVPGNVEEKDDGKKDDDEDDDEKDDAKDDEKDDAKDEETGAGETEGAAAEGGEAGLAGTGTKKSGTGTKKAGTGTTTKDSGDTKTGDTKTGDTKTSGKKEPDVDCLLNPKLAKCSGDGGGSNDGGTKPTADTSLPKKLGQTEISKGLASVKTTAKACGPKNGAAAGTGVAIKFSVSGSDGSVISATATGDGAGTPLAKCVEAAAKKATFPKFQESQQGFQFTFRM
jgi:predicted Zn finger-like uncharacterized protein